jgi:NAD(P)-dependent dehydrogenase (short-subunit alcohol dehydrogenase family)
MSSIAGALSLQSKAALVTGAASGIGRATALTLAEAGAAVVATDRDADGLEETVRSLDGPGPKAIAICADLSSRREIEALVERANGEVAAIDVLVNVAAVHLYPAPLLEMSESDWDRVLAVNLKSCLSLCQLVAPAMVERNTGCIVNIASDSAFDVIPGEGAYGISKIGIAKLTAYLAKELAGSKVRTNAIAPGWVKTPATRRFWSDPDTLRGAEEGVPLRRMADPREIANVVLFLASDLASYVNGHCMVVDGGRIAGVPG